MAMRSQNSIRSQCRSAAPLPHSTPSYRIFRAFSKHTAQICSSRRLIKASGTSGRAFSLPLPSPSPRIFGVSDCHTDYIENFKWAESLDKQAFRNDILLLAGDVCDELTLLEDTLKLLKTTFASVFYCPGNHDLWIRSTDSSKNSLEKLQHIVALCNALEVHTTPQKIDNKVWIAPLQSWHHKSFDVDPEIPDIPAVSPLTIADYAACTWPTDHLPPGSLRHGSIELAEWFDRMNTGPTWDAMLETRHECDVISFSHFLPHLALLPEKRFLFYPGLAKASGSIPLAKRIAALKPDIHLFGHTHFAWDAMLPDLPGTRFIQAPLAAPPERQRRLRTLCFNAFMTEEKRNDTINSSSSITGTSRGSTWKTKDDPLLARWLPVELFQFNNQLDLYSAENKTNSNNSDRKLSLAISSFIECQHRGPNEPLRDQFTAANEATHGITISTPVDDTGADVVESFTDEDDPLILCSKTIEIEKDKASQRRQLKHGSMPGPLGAHWSDYYATNPRTPENTTLAPWVAHVYEKRKQRRQKVNAAAATTSSSSSVD